MEKKLSKKTLKILESTDRITNCKIGIDNTDHIYPVCNKCGFGMGVIDFAITKAYIDLYFYCGYCKLHGKRRIIFSQESNDRWYKLFSPRFGQPSAISGVKP